MGKNRGEYTTDVEKLVEHLNEKFPDLHLYYLHPSSSSHMVGSRGQVLKHATGPKPLVDFLEGYMCGLRNYPRK